MLQAVLTDFAAWGEAHVVTTLDNRLADLALTAQRVVRLHHAEHRQSLAELARQVDAVLIIAPESDGILTWLTALLQETGTPVLGGDASAVAAASDKWECFVRFKQAGLPTPATWRVSRAEVAAAGGELGFPVVVKPIDGAGCEGVGLASDRVSLEKALSLIDPSVQDILLQRYMVGTAASVSLLVSPAGALPLSLNEQQVATGLPFHYQGGAVPMRHSKEHLARDYAKRAVSLLPGLGGYVGVDMVLAEDQCYLIEINPRLTTSYVGLRQVININLAEAIWRACMEEVLPQNVILSGAVSFRKEDFNVSRHA